MNSNGFSRQVRRPGARRAPVWLPLLAAVLVAAGGVAQESPYAGLEEREIKSLSPEQIGGYLAGGGMGFALAGELNGYPGPKHVLELREDLDLSVEQLADIERIFDTMQSAAVELGTAVVEHEARLDELFAGRTIDAEMLARMTEEIGRLNGRLRAVHLQAHLATAEVLSSHQTMLYAQLRGYGEAGGEHRGHH